MDSLSIFSGLVLCILGSNAQNPTLECYSCTVNAVVPENDPCVYHPEQVEGRNIIECPDGYCITERQELTEELGIIRSFLRACTYTSTGRPEEFLDKNAHFHHHYKWCRESLCNDDEGIVEDVGKGGGSISTLSWTLALGCLLQLIFQFMN